MNRKEMLERIEELTCEKVEQVYAKMKPNEEYTADELYEMSDKDFFVSASSLVSLLCYRKSIYSGSYRFIPKEKYYIECDSEGNILNSEIKTIKKNNQYCTYYREFTYEK